MRSGEEAYHELSAYTLSHGDRAFIHQYIVDAYGVQQADTTTTPIRVAFGLIGLYLHVERGFTGRQVQRVHMQLAEERNGVPAFELPDHRGDVTVIDVMAAAAGPRRDAAIDKGHHRKRLPTTPRTGQYAAFHFSPASR